MFDCEVELPLPYAITLLFTDLPCVIQFRLTVQHGKPEPEYRVVKISICIIAGLFVVYELDIIQNLYPHFPPRYQNSTPFTSFHTASTTTERLVGTHF